MKESLIAIPISKFDSSFSWVHQVKCYLNYYYFLKQFIYNLILLGYSVYLVIDIRHFSKLEIPNFI